MADNELTTQDLAAAADRRRDDQSRPEPDAAPTDAQASQDGAQASQNGHEPLLPAHEGDRFKSRWVEIQASFVDEPQRSVEQADALVADLMQRLAATFSEERENLEGQWAKGDDVSTEDLRVALTRYRSFFDRLLSA